MQFVSFVYRVRFCIFMRGSPWSAVHDLREEWSNTRERKRTFVLNNDYLVGPYMPGYSAIQKQEEKKLTLPK